MFVRSKMSFICVHVKTSQSAYQQAGPLNNVMISPVYHYCVVSSSLNQHPRYESPSAAASFALRFSSLFLAANAFFSSLLNFFSNKPCTSTEGTDASSDLDPGAPGFVFGGASPGLNESGTCAAMPAEPDPHPSILASQNIPLMLCGLVLFVVSSVLMMGNKFEGYCRELSEVEE
jgi:hypothetical protein